MLRLSFELCSRWVPLVNQSARVFFNRAFSSCYAILKSCNNSETAAYGCRVDVLQKVIFTSIVWYFGTFKLNT